MAERLLRVYKKMDVTKVKLHLMIYGDLSGSCAHCNQMDLKLDETQCPACKAEFQYIAFRNVKSHMPKIRKLFEERPDLGIIDFEDYKRNMGTAKAEEFFK